MAEILGQVDPAVRVTRLTHRALDDFTGDMWLVVEYQMPRFALRVGDGLEFSPPAARAVKGQPLLFPAGSVSWPKTRQTDVFLLNETGTNGPGWPTEFWVEGSGQWSGPAALAIEA